VVTVGQVGFGGGFAQQTTFGPGNVEVFFPWPDGGFAQYWWDRATGVWHGPVVCVGVEHGHFSSVSWYEGDYQSHDGENNNFELVAVGRDRIAHYYRENTPPLRWTRGYVEPRTDSNRPTRVVAGRTHRNGGSSTHEDLEIYCSMSEDGIYRLWREAFTGSWDGHLHQEFIHGHSTGIPDFYEMRTITGVFTGVGWARGTVHTPDSDFEDSYNGEHIVVAVGADGTFTAFDEEQRRQHIGDGVRGQPCVIQTDRGRRDPLYGPDEHGHYEAFAPAKAGGIAHFWRANPGDQADEPAPWHAAGVVGSDLYDEVSAIQLRDEDTADSDETAPLWLFARVDGQTWVDLYQQRHLGDGNFRWEQLPTIGNPRRTDVVVTVPRDFAVLNPLESGEVFTIDYVCYRGSPTVWTQVRDRATTEAAPWTPLRDSGLRAEVDASHRRRFGRPSPDIDHYQRYGTIDTPLLAAGAVVRVWATTDPTADPNRPGTDLTGERAIVTTIRPAHVVSRQPVSATPGTDRVTVSLVADADPVCVIAEIGTGAPRPHRPYGREYHAFDLPIGRIVDCQFRPEWTFELTRNGRAPADGVLVPGGTYTVIVRAMTNAGDWTEVVAPVTLRQRQVDIAVDRVEIVASGDSGAAEGWFAAEIHSGRWVDGTAARVRRWQFGDDDNWAELEDGDVFGTGGSVHPTGPPWHGSIGPDPVAVRPFGVRLEVFDKDGVFEPDEQASGEWDTDDDRPVTDVPFEVRTGRTPPYVTAKANGRYSIRYVAPVGQPDPLLWQPLPAVLGPDLPVGRDYDGDGELDPAVWRSATGTWLIATSPDGPPRTERLGEPGDLPVPGDYGTAAVVPAVLRPGDRTLHVLVHDEPTSHYWDSIPPRWLPTTVDSLATLITDLAAAGDTVTADTATRWRSEVEAHAYDIAAMWRDRSVAAHPVDVPTQVAAARHALDVYLGFARLPSTPQSRLAIVARELDLLARLIVFGTPDSAPGTEVFEAARAVHARLTDRDHRVDIATSWTSQAITHHETAFHPQQANPADELTRQRAAAAQAATILFPLVDGLDDPASAPLAPELLLTVAQDLDALARYLVFGSDDSTAGVAAATRARTVYRALSPTDHWHAIANSFTNEALTHHEIGVHLLDPAKQHAELTAQRAAARHAVTTYQNAATSAHEWPPAEKHAVVAALRRLAAPEGLLLFGLRDDDPDLSTSHTAAQQARRLADSLDQSQVTTP
jgi:hypothetical protein